MLIKMIVQSQKCLFRDRAMNDCKSLCFILKKYISCCNKVFHRFCLKDFGNIFWITILRHNMSIADDVITQLFVILTIIRIQ